MFNLSKFVMFLLSSFALLLISVHEVFSVNACYFCLDCESYNEYPTENCSERYKPGTKTQCVSVKADTSDILVRKQCMSDAQAESFCKKFNSYEGVKCFSCDTDLCNSGNVLKVFFLLHLLLFIVF